MKVTFAATQFACSPNAAENLESAERAVRAAAAQGAQVILLQELFETPYFCKDHSVEHFNLARPIEGSPVVARFQALARELSVVLPLSVFERHNNAYFNSLAMIDADGAVLGVYRKSHIPEGPGYHEKYYFSPGDTGFRVWKTRYGTLGVGICWDQWFPEAARCMALMGADALLYPTAIGSEPHDASID
jgi:N-carbamoylputrescine amidase